MVKSTLRLGWLLWSGVFKNQLPLTQKYSQQFNTMIMSFHSILWSILIQTLLQVKQGTRVNPGWVDYQVNLDFQALKVNKEKGDLTADEVPQDTQECLVTKASIKLNTCITETFSWNMTRISRNNRKKKCWWLIL